MNFSPNYICRGVLTVPRMIPKSWLKLQATGHAAAEMALPVS